ncbi:hypothetical protein MCOR27_007953 [Pyricularia oryzae]|uniref:Uncharacterized protein n=1 Tax=Pyricularia grisea TaxID=148305 RepID=A0ABQ8NHL6_PYRGI|nr:hypothetical protein MCOR01_005473 [Pyricularia oryzae]KAI6297245.1 hypothetical protein MCOR33_006382 [Pyricularia grisea]KAH9434686.1 hypothetical protein MCOR02_003651 [Pyricularia oryzae]KAI6261841.1 hypothetical protein MCOR19_001925 [Pyricularia oryzae]KAI6273294.1 hypothetical protein MCOR27_007953 [Pyricularia oryzae]
MHISKTLKFLSLAAFAAPAVLGAPLAQLPESSNGLEARDPMIIHQSGTQGLKPRPGHSSESDGRAPEAKCPICLSTLCSCPPID